MLGTSLYDDLESSRMPAWPSRLWNPIAVADLAPGERAAGLEGATSSLASRRVDRFVQPTDST